MQGRHLTNEEMDGLVRATLSRPALTRVEEHLLVCEQCRQCVEELAQLVASLGAADTPGPLDMTHATADGPIRLQTRRQENGAWRAELCGAEIQSLGTFGSCESANAFVQRVFYEMFPEHVCNAGCLDGARRTP